MSRAMVIIRGDADRRKAAQWVQRAPTGSRIEFKRSRRTLPQNAMLWSILTDISQQVPWHGLKLTPDDWKLIFLDALKREMRMVPNLDGNGFVSLGRSSSDLSKDEMGELIELIQAFAARQGVTLSNHQTEAA